MKSDGIRVALDQCEAFSDKNSTSFCQFILNEFINKVLQSSAETNSKITGQTTETCEEICRTSDQNKHCPLSQFDKAIFLEPFFSLFPVVLSILKFLKRFCVFLYSNKIYSFSTLLCFFFVLMDERPASLQNAVRSVIGQCV